jgi:type IV pilus assembly protein PilA
MVRRIRQRLDGYAEQSSGFTLIELLVVIIIIGILLAIAVPSYLGFRDRAANSTAKSNLRAAIPAAEAYFADNGSYVGMESTDLAAIDSSISASLSVASTTATTYCLTETVMGKTWSIRRSTASTDSTAADFYNSSDCS